MESLEQFAVDVILDRKHGKRADLLRSTLLVLSAGYRWAVTSRLRLYRGRILRETPLGVPVVSVGNLTVGGTGKTPVVEMLARELAQRGKRVAILSRGYKSVPKPLLVKLWSGLRGKRGAFAPRIVSDGTSLLLDSRTAGDEPFMLANNVRGVPVLVDKDRVRCGNYAVRKFGAEVLLLDDGLQYLPLKHRWNIVLVDCQSPFGNGHLLPRGILREPKNALRRATHILLTKSDGHRGQLEEEIRRFNRTASIIECAHRPVHLRNLFDGRIEPLEFLDGLKVACVSGIARPESFEGGLRALGAKIQLTRRYADHHRFAGREITNLVNQAERKGLNAILTTEKDAVRFPRIIDPAVPIYFLRVEIEILRGQEHLEHLLNSISLAKGAYAASSSR